MTLSHLTIRKRHWHLISKWTFGLVNALNHHWCETSYYLKLFWSMWCSEVLFSRILCVVPVLYSEETYGIVSYLIFSMSFYITFKKRTLACGSQVGNLWVTSGLLCGSVGQWVNMCDPLSTLMLNVGIWYSIIIGYL